MEVKRFEGSLPEEVEGVGYDLRPWKRSCKGSRRRSWWGRMGDWIGKNKALLEGKLGDQKRVLGQ